MHSTPRFFADKRDVFFGACLLGIPLNEVMSIFVSNGEVKINKWHIFNDSVVTYTSFSMTEVRSW